VARIAACAIRGARPLMCFALHPGYALAAVGRISVNVMRRSAIEGHASGQQLQMPHRERAVPFVVEVFTHEPTVAVMRLRLGAQETRSVERN
jgi:hypothetical protein